MTDFIDLIISMITQVWNEVNSWYFADMPVSYGQFLLGGLILTGIFSFFDIGAKTNSGSSSKEMSNKSRKKQLIKEKKGGKTK